MTESTTERIAQFNPFPGLRPFDSKENHLFFGRDGQSDELLRRLRQNRFLAVVGTSGSGKSSLVRAGLLPSLYGGFMMRAGSNWRVAIFRPGNNPLGNLAQALFDPSVLGATGDDELINRTIIETTLRRSALGLVEAVRQARIPVNENLLIVVDQFEEIFRFKESKKSEGADDEAAAFVKLLLEAASQEEVPIYVVITMRSDFLGDCAQFRDLPEAINDGQYLIPRMTRDQRRQAITGPVAVGGAEIAPRLVNRLLNDVGDNPDQLPILQHALMRTWQHWTHECDRSVAIDLEHYEAIGGMAEALSRHADKAYHELSSDRSRKIAEKLFKCLTDRGPDNRETRRPTKLKGICAVAEAAEDEVIAVIDSFRRQGRSFLMPPASVQLNGDTLIDISHESLIRGWKRLREWVDEEAESARIYRRLAETAALHKQGRAGLWHDPDLQLALLWRDQNRPNQAWAERYYPDFASTMAFLDESKRKNEEEIAEKERERVEKEKQRRKNLRRTQVFATVLGIAFLVSLFMMFYAYQQRALAVELKKIAEQKADEAIKAQQMAELQGKIATQRAVELQKANEQLAQAQQETELALHTAQAAQREAITQKEIAQQNEKKARRARDEAINSEMRARASEENFVNTALTMRRQYLGHSETIKDLSEKLIEASSPQERVYWRFVKAQALSDMGDHIGAIKESTAGLSIDPENLDLRMLRGYMYMIDGKAPDSVQDFEVVLKGNPRSSLGYLNIAISQGLMASYGDAISSIEKAIKYFTHGDYGTLLETKVSEDIQTASKHKVLSVDDSAFHSALYYERATLLAAARRDGFFEALREADKQPATKDTYLTALNWGWLHFRRKHEDYGILASQAYLWERAGYPTWAKKYYQDFLDNYQQHPDNRYQDLARWVKIRMAHPSSGNSPQLVVVDTQKSERNLLSLMAQESSQEGDFNKATELLTQALGLTPGGIDVDLIFQRAWARYRNNDVEGARADVETILANAPDTTNAYLLRAYINETKNKTAAEADFRRALQNNPEQSWALFYLARLVEDDKPEEAISLYQRHFKMRPFDSDVLLPLAKLQQRRGHYEDALKTIQAAIAMKGTDLSLYDVRAEIELNLKKSYGEVMRNKASGYQEASVIMLKRGRPTAAAETYVKSLQILTSSAERGTGEDFRCDVAVTMGKISRLIEDASSKKNAIGFWQEVLKGGKIKSYEPLVQEEIRRLSGSK